MRGVPAFASLACEVCRPAVQAGIFNEHFLGRLSITLLPFIIILCVVAVLHRSGARRAPAPSGAREE